MKNISLTLFISLAVSYHAASQNVGINSTGATPATSAMLDVSATDKGLLIPRVALTASNVAAPITSPATSLLVYNTATAGTAPNNVVPGYYYWNGTSWAGLSSSTSWTLTGNAGTTPATNFIGTTDAVDFAIRTGNTEKARFTSIGRFGLGNTTPSEILDVTGNVKFSGALMPNNNAGTAGFLLTSNGPGAAPTWNAAPSVIGSYWALDGTNVTTTRTLGTTNNFSLPIITNNIERMRIDNAGRVGIGTSTFDATNPEKFVVNAGNTTSVNAIVGKGSVNNYLQLNIQNQSGGANASSDVVATANNGSETTNFIDMGINSSANTADIMGAPNDAYLYNLGQNLLIGTGTAAKSLVFVTGGTTQSTNERMRIDGNGNVGIGTTTIPKGGIGAAKLAIDGVNGSMNGPHLQFTTAADNYPLMNFLSWTHDNSYVLFDTYWDGTTWRSSTNAGGNFRWQKNNGFLQLGYANVNTQGAAIATFSPGWILSSSGNVAIGTSTFSTNAEKLVVDAGTTTSFNAIVGKGSIDNYLQLNIQNQSNGTNASSDVVATANNGNETTNYIDMGINSGSYTGGVMGGVNDSYLYNIGQNMLIGTGTAAKSLILMTGGTTQATNERMRITGTGNVGIGNNNPNSTLSVTGSLTMSVRTNSGATTVSATDYAVINTGGAATWTLPAANTCTGRTYRLVNHGTGNITLSQSVTTSNGATTTTLSNSTLVGVSLEIISDGTVWRKLN